MKKALSIILSICMLLSITAGLNFSAYADELPSSGKCGANATYTFDSETGLLTISGTGNIYSYYNMSNSPFYNQSCIKSVVINNGITDIGNSAFYGCTGLTSIEIPNSVTSIGASAFVGCTGLTSIEIPNSVTSIGDYAFVGCTGLTSIALNSVTNIGESAFSGCTGLTSIALNNVTNIGESAFSGCTGLTSIEIPNSVTSIGDGAFSGCTELTDISVGLENEYFDSRNNCNACIDSSTNQLVFGCKNTVIPDSVTSIRGSAFKGCTGLTSIEIPDSVTSIGSSAFSGCSGLTSIEIPDGVTSIGYSVFNGCTGLTSITIPDGVTSIGDYSFYNCSGIKELTMPCSAQFFINPFYGCVNIEKVTITKGTGTMQEYVSYHTTDRTATSYQETPWNMSKENCKEIIIEDGVQNISNYAFSDCTGLTNITIPDSVTSIGSYAFSGCTGLTSIEIPSSVKSIGDYAFRYCNKLTSIVIPNGVTSIGDYAFSSCSGLSYIDLPNSISSIGNNAFSSDALLYRGSEDDWSNIEIDSDYTSINSMHILYCPETKSGRCGTGLNYSYVYENGEGVLTITGTGDMVNPSAASSGVFYKLGVDRLIIEEGVTSIGNYAFYQSVGIKSVEIADSVTNIGESAFYGCTGLTNIALNSVTNIGKSAFSNCTGLTSIEIPNSVTSISSSAFEGCEGLTSVDLGNSVKSIGSSAFRYCSSLTSIEIPNSVTSIGNSVFYSCYGLENAKIGNGITSLGTVFNNCTALKTLEIGTGLSSINSSALSGCKNLETVYLYSKNMSTTDPLVSQMPKGSTLYAYESTDAELYCDIYEVNYVALEDPRCSEGIHTYEEKIIKAPTCETSGTKRFECKYCGDYYDVTIDPTGHTAVVDEAVAPTCQQTGLTAGSHCSVCGKILEAQQTVPLSNHQYSSTVYPPNCAQQGFTLHSCIWCGDSYKDDFTPTTDDHNYREVITTPATCASTGIKTYTCTICGNSYTEAIPAKGHTVVTIEAVAPTCTESGHTEGSQCSVCGMVITPTRVIAAMGHRWDTGTVTTSPTCQSTGVKTYTCTTCGATQTVTLEKTGHTIVIDKAVPATCTKTGLTEGQHCSVCGEVVVAQTLVEAHHEYYKTIVAPTCSSMGYRMYTCEECGFSYIDRYYDKVDHDFKDGEKYCIFGCKTVNPDFECEHNWEIKSRNEATCIAAGKQVSECSICGEEKTEVLPILEHSFVMEKYDATPNAQGYTKYTCPVCSYAYVADITPYASDASALETAIAEAHYYSNSKFSASQIQLIIDEAESHRALSETNAPQAEYDYAVGEILTAIYSVDELAAYTPVSMDGDTVTLENELGEEREVSFEEAINEYEAPLDVVKDGIVNAKDFAWLIKHSS